MGQQVLAERDDDGGGDAPEQQNPAGRDASAQREPGCGAGAADEADVEQPRRTRAR